MNQNNLTSEQIDIIHESFQSIDSEWGPVTESERIVWGDIMRAMGREGYRNWWYHSSSTLRNRSSLSTAQEWY
ncbi:hypothetical protein LCGC14_1835140 [marine sediment metagenome]|uniref:Uncharacterized protein n=1 Tax=marine sediment metagenome TaxID=412755 RepID=A0A0F9H348_9ZZZZ